jgi:hypothetical protein
VHYMDAFHETVAEARREVSVSVWVELWCPWEGNMRDGRPPIESRDLYVLVETLLNRAQYDSFNDPIKLSAEIDRVIWFAAQLYGEDLAATSTLDVARSLLRMGRRATALQKVRSLLVL